MGEVEVEHAALQASTHRRPRGLAGGKIVSLGGRPRRGPRREPERVPVSVGLHPPVLPVDLVPRPELMDRLARGLQGPVVVVSAPAGFGKTTLLSAWVAQCQHPTAWLSLENGAGLKDFTHAVTTAIRRAVPDVKTGTSEMIQARRAPSPAELAGSLVDDLDCVADPCTIVLDDYQGVTLAEVHELVAAFARRLPGHIHLAITTRGEIPAAFATLRARGAITDIGPVDLRFGLRETQLFVERILRAAEDEDVIASLLDRTEGWPAGLRLAALVLREQADRRAWVQAFARGSHAYVRDFLVDDVLATQPRSMQDILLRTSVLDRFCAQELEAVLGLPDSGPRGDELIQTLLRSNLFVVQLDPDGEWYRFHQLFREALQAKLLADWDPEAVAQLHQRAVCWLEGMELIDEAIRHALAAGDLTRAATIVEEHVQGALDHGDWEALEGWLDLLPAGVRDQRPALLLALAWTLQAHNRHAELAPVLNSVERLLHEHPAAYTNVEVLAAEAEALRSIVLGYSGAHAEALALAERAHARLPQTRSYARGFAWHVAGLALQRLGRADVAVERLGAVIDAADWDDYPSLFHGLSTLVRLHFAGLDLAATEDIATRLVLLGEMHQLASAEALGHLYLGRVYYERNELDRAGAHFEATAGLRHGADLTVWTRGILGLALIDQAQGRSEPAAAAMREVEDLAWRMGGPSELAFARVFQARLALVRGDVEAASRFLRGTRSDSPRTSMLEIEPYMRAIWLLRLDTADAVAEALHIADEIERTGQSWAHHRILLQAALIRSLAFEQCGRADDALVALDRAIGLTRAAGAVRTFVDLGLPMQQLLLKLHRHGSSDDAYLEELLRSFPDQRDAASATSHPRQSERQERGETPTMSDLDALTWREQEVLELLSQRLSNKEIAERLVVSPLTVKRHTIAIYRKLGVQGRREAVTLAANLQVARPTEGAGQVAELASSGPDVSGLVRSFEDLRAITRRLQEVAHKGTVAVPSWNEQDVPHAAVSARLRTSPPVHLEV